MAILFIVLFVINSIFTMVLFGTSPQESYAMLYENGTCTNQSLTNSSKHVINTTGTVEDFLKSLPSDNAILAEIICNDNSNDTDAN